jgi:FdhD protein
MPTNGAAHGRSTFVRRTVRGTDSNAAWGIAVETPIEIGINDVPWTVMLATPADLEDLAIGLAFTERIIASVDAVERIDVAEYLEGIAVNLTVPRHQVDESARRSRLLEGRTGCGLCGVESLAALRRSPSAAARPVVPITTAAIHAAFARLPEFQPINKKTRSIHAAAWCATDGRIEVCREDVGRHNALDKVIGTTLRGKPSSDAGFIVMSSRCSFELVYKAAAGGASLLATISAPTSLALEWADALHLPLACRGSESEIILFDAEADHGD